MADVKKTVKKVEVKKEKKNTEALEKKEVAYKKLIWFVPRITSFVEEWKNAKILNDKAKVYTKMLNLLYTSVSMLLNQNLNTYTNSLISIIIVTYIFMILEKLCILRYDEEISLNQW